MTPEAFRRLLEQSGISEGKPLHAVMLTLHEATLAARETAAGARGLTPEGERELVQRVADQAGHSVDTSLERRLWWAQLSLVLRGAVLAMGLVMAGYGMGTWQATQRAPAAVAAKPIAPPAAGPARR